MAVPRGHGLAGRDRRADASRAQEQEAVGQGQGRGRPGRGHPGAVKAHSDVRGRPPGCRGHEHAAREGAEGARPVARERQDGEEDAPGAKGSQHGPLKDALGGGRHAEKGHPRGGARVGVHATGCGGEDRPRRGVGEDGDVGGGAHEHGGKRDEGAPARTPHERDQARHHGDGRAASENENRQGRAAGVHAARANGGAGDAGGAVHEQGAGLGRAVGGQDRQGHMCEYAGQDAVRRADEEGGCERPGQREQKSDPQRGGQGAGGHPRDHRGQGRGSDEEEGLDGAGRDAQGRRGGAEQGQEDRQGVGAPGIAVAARDPSGPRGVPQLGPRGGRRGPRAADESGVRPPPLEGREKRGQDEESDGDGRRPKTVAPHRGDDERVDAFAVFVLVDVGWFFAQ